MKKLYPSNSAFMWGDLVITDTNSGCLRSILLTGKGIRTSIPAIYSKVGAVHEEFHAGEIEANSQIASYDREKALQRDLTDEVRYSGRADFVCVYEAVGPVIHETKSTISKNSRLKVIRKGIVKINQLAQLVSYMINFQVTRGKLVVGYYEYEEEVLTWQEGREFRVLIDDDGRIIMGSDFKNKTGLVPKGVDVSHPVTTTGYTVLDQMRHQMAAAKVLENDTIAPRPRDAEKAYGGPCQMCVFRTTCDKYDQGLLSSVEEFADSAQQDVARYENSDKKEPLPFTVKSKGGQK